jgi:hypothetical protein
MLARLSGPIRMPFHRAHSLNALPMVNGCDYFRPFLNFPALGCLVLLNAKFSCDEPAKPDMCGVVVPLAMPHDSQDERRQSQGLGARLQVKVFAKSLNDRFLNARHQIARRHGVQYRKAVRERQSEAAPKSSRSELVIDEPPSLIAIDDRGMIQPCKQIKRKLALPHRMTAPRNNDVVLLRNRFHEETWR